MIKISMKTIGGKMQVLDIHIILRRRLIIKFHTKAPLIDNSNNNSSISQCIEVEALFVEALDTKIMFKGEEELQFHNQCHNITP